MTARPSNRRRRRLSKYARRRHLRKHPERTEQ